LTVKNHIKNRENHSTIHIILSYLPTKKQEQCRKIIIPVKKQKKGLWFTYFGKGGAAVFAFLWIILALSWVFYVVNWG